MSRIAFITGITGQDGSYLSELLLEKGYKVYGIIRRTSLFNTTRIDHIREHITLRYGDLTDGAGLSNYINDIVRENEGFEQFEIYNLAAQSHVAISFEIPEYTADVDGIGVMRILEIIRTLPDDVRHRVRFYQAGTSELYGDVLETPQKETTPFNPVSPYAAAKLYGYYMTKVYREGYKMYAVNGVLFNHESSRRGENFLTMKVVNAVKDIMSGKKELVELGNLDSKRDWGHAKDYVNGMWLMMQQDFHVCNDNDDCNHDTQKLPQDYVLATGETHLVRTFVEKAFKYGGYDINWEGEGVEEIGVDQEGVVRVRINPKYYRPCEVDLLLGDPTRACEELGWVREIDSLDGLIEEMFTSE